MLYMYTSTALFSQNRVIPCLMLGCWVLGVVVLAVMLAVYQMHLDQSTQIGHITSLENLSIFGSFLCFHSHL